MKKLKIIKFGGSIITDKSSNVGVLKHEKIAEIGELIREMSEKFDLVIVLGAGSFGHPLAKKFRLKDGISGDFSGALLTHASIEDMQNTVIGNWLKMQLRVLAFSPMVGFLNGKVQADGIEKIIEKGLIPVLHGDVVFDQKNGIRIMSGDEIVIELARMMKVDQVVFVTNGDGLFNEENQTIKKINKTDLIKKISLLNEKTSGADVTKGFYGKIEWCVRHVPEAGIRIIDGNMHQNLKKGLLENQGGTLILPD